jgi:predicted  nucleic acid-binding Zn-ribbon protein
MTFPSGKQPPTRPRSGVARAAAQDPRVCSNHQSPIDNRNGDRELSRTNSNIDQLQILMQNFAANQSQHTHYDLEAKQAQILIDRLRKEAEIDARLAAVSGYGNEVRNMKVKAIEDAEHRRDKAAEEAQKVDVTQQSLLNEVGLALAGLAKSASASALAAIKNEVALLKEHNRKQQEHNRKQEERDRKRAEDNQDLRREVESLRALVKKLNDQKAETLAVKAANDKFQIANEELSARLQNAEAELKVDKAMLAALKISLDGSAKASEMKEIHAMAVKLEGGMAAMQAEHSGLRKITDELRSKLSELLKRQGNFEDNVRKDEFPWDKAGQAVRFNMSEASKSMEEVVKSLGEQLEALKSTVDDALLKVSNNGAQDLLGRLDVLRAAADKSRVASPSSAQDSRTNPLEIQASQQIEALEKQLAQQQGQLQSCLDIVQRLNEQVAGLAKTVDGGDGELGLTETLTAAVGECYSNVQSLERQLFTGIDGKPGYIPHLVTTTKNQGDQIRSLRSTSTAHATSTRASSVSSADDQAAHLKGSFDRQKRKVKDLDARVRVLEDSMAQEAPTADKTSLEDISTRTEKLETMVKGFQDGPYAQSPKDIRTLSWDLQKVQDRIREIEGRLMTQKLPTDAHQNLLAEVKRLDEADRHLRAEVQRLIMNLQPLEGQVRNSGEGIRQLQARFDNLTTNEMFQGIAHHLTELVPNDIWMRNWDARLNQVNTKASHAAASNEDTKVAILEAQGKANTAEALAQGLSAKVEELGNTLAGVQPQLDKTKIQINDADTTMKNIQSALTDVQSTANNADALAKSIADTVTDLKTSVNSLKPEVTKAQGDASAAVETANAASSAINDLKATVEAAESQIDDKLKIAVDAAVEEKLHPDGPAPDDGEVHLQRNGRPQAREDALGLEMLMKEQGTPCKGGPASSSSPSIASHPSNISNSSQRKGPGTFSRGSSNGSPAFSSSPRGRGAQRSRQDLTPRRRNKLQSVEDFTIVKDSDDEDEDPPVVNGLRKGKRR